MVSQLLAAFLSPCSTHQLTAKKRKQTNIHIASHTRLQLPSPHGRKENTPTFHTIAAHGLLQLQLDTQGNRSHQLMAQKKQTRLHMVYYNRTYILTATLNIQDLQGITQ